jgi:hypothetical protein
MSALCVPVVISDWFVFAYRWWIPYNEFIIRVSEADFLSDPNSVLDYIKQSYTADKIASMKKAMMKWRIYTQYELLSSVQNNITPTTTTTTTTTTTGPYAVPKVMYPLELMLLEMKKALAELAELTAKNPKVRIYYYINIITLLSYYLIVKYNILYSIIVAICVYLYSKLICQTFHFFFFLLLLLLLLLLY